MSPIDRRSVLAAGAAMALPAPSALAATNANTSTQASFDFLAGDWDVTHRKLKERLANCDQWLEFKGTLSVRSILGGLGNFDINHLHDPAGEYSAHSLRLFNPTSRLWSIWWLDSRSPEIGVPVVGAFLGRKGQFFGEETFNGRPIDVRTTYETLTPTMAQWTQAFSLRGEGVWETNWIMDFRRAG